MRSGWPAGRLGTRNEGTDMFGTPGSLFVRVRFAGAVRTAVVLTVLTRGFRDLIVARDESPAGRVVRTLVPVSVRLADERGAYNNRVSAMFAELPVGISDPAERLDAIRTQMAGLKESKQAVAG